MKPIKSKGQGQVAIGIAVSVVMLLVTVVVVSTISDQSSTAIPSTSTSAQMAVGNISSYMWQGITLASVGLILVAGLALIGSLVMRR